MGPILNAAYRRIPSFRREAGGLHATYVTVHSAIYAARMRRKHQRGRHGPASHGICHWCGATT